MHKIFKSSPAPSNGYPPPLPRMSYPFPYLLVHTTTLLLRATTRPNLMTSATSSVYPPYTSHTTCTTPALRHIMSTSTTLTTWNPLRMLFQPYLMRKKNNVLLRCPLLQPNWDLCPRWNRICPIKILLHLRPPHRSLQRNHFFASSPDIDAQISAHHNHKSWQKWMGERNSVHLSLGQQPYNGRLRKICPGLQ